MNFEQMMDEIELLDQSKSSKASKRRSFWLRTATIALMFLIGLGISRLIGKEIKLDFGQIVRIHAKPGAKKTSSLTSRASTPTRIFKSHLEALPNVKKATKEDSAEGLLKQLGTPVFFFFCDHKASFCPKFISEIHKIAKKHPEVDFVEVDLEKAPQIAEDLSIEQPGSFYLDYSKKKSEKREGFVSMSMESKTLNIQGINNVKAYPTVFKELDATLTRLTSK